MDVEIRRLKNRVRQQRYRARKREERAKRYAHTSEMNHTVDLEENSQPEDLPMCSKLSVANEHPLSRHDEGSIDTEANSRQQEDIDICREELVQGDNENNNQGTKEQVNSSIMGILHMDQFASPACDQSTVPSESFQITLPAFHKMDNDCLNTNLTTQCTDKRHNDLTARRQKNRERQRRYRARKRLEADMKNALFGYQPSPFRNEEAHVTAPLPKHMDRVYCSRDWKKDARMAHPSKDQDIAELETEPAVEGEVLLAPVIEMSCNEVNDAAIHGRRDWKVEARNKSN